MKVMLLVGSGDAKSHSLSLGQSIETELKKLGAETELINLIEYKLPMYDRAVERAKAQDEITKAFLDKSYDVDAFVWITPIHHNSFSAILKNALDWQHTKFPGKVVGLASNGGNRSPQAVDQLMMVARAQHLVATRIRVCAQEDDYDDNKQLTNPNIQSRVVDFCDELVEMAKRVGN